MLSRGCLIRESAYYTHYHINTTYMRVKRPSLSGSSWPLLGPIWNSHREVINHSDWSVSDTAAALPFFDGTMPWINLLFAQASVPWPHTPQFTLVTFRFYKITGNRHRTECWSWRSGQQKIQFHSSIFKAILFWSLVTFDHISEV